MTKGKNELEANFKWLDDAEEPPKQPDTPAPLKEAAIVYMATYARYMQFKRKVKGNAKRDDITEYGGLQTWINAIGDEVVQRISDYAKLKSVPALEQARQLRVTNNPLKYARESFMITFIAAFTRLNELELKRHGGAVFVPLGVEHQEYGELRLWYESLDIEVRDAIYYACKQLAEIRDEFAGKF